MADMYISVKAEASAEYTDRKSVFIGYVIADQHDASGHFFADSPIEVLSVSYEDESIFYRTEENT